MIVLGIETSTDVCSVGLATTEKTYERSLRESRIHSEKLITLIDEVLHAAHLGVKQLEAVAVSGGPGSFTGLRIGVSAAKGLVAATGCRFVAVPTFQALRMTARKNGNPPEPFLVALDAKQGEWYCIDSRELDDADEAHLLAEEECLRRANGRNVVTDAGEKFSAVAASVTGVDRLVSGASVALFGTGMLANGRDADVSSFEPSYVKDFVVRTKAKQSGQRSQHGVV